MHRHFTATAFIVDSKKRTLLLFHKRLHRWMPPGGHIGPDEMPEEAARRECKEETGLDVEIVGEPSEDLFAGNPEEGRMLRQPIAFLLENIPASEEPFDSAPVQGLPFGPEGPQALSGRALLGLEWQGRRGEPAHQHMDFLYIARPLDEAQVVTLETSEGREIRWFTREEIAALDERTEIFANVQAYILSVLSEGDTM